MEPIEGTYRDGQIQWDSPPDWPEGTRVVIIPIDEFEEHFRPRPTWGLPDELMPDTPENNAEIFRRMKAAEPVELTDEEFAAWEADRQAMKEYNIAAVRKQMGLDRNDAENGTPTGS